MPHSEQVLRAGGLAKPEVLIGLPLRDIHTLLLVGRRLRGYSDQLVLVDPLAMGELAELILNVLPPEEMITWLDGAR